MVDRIPMTPDGYRQLRNELDQLVAVERPRIAQQIAKARSYGDLSENSEYHSAKEKQAFIEAKIRELEDKLARAHVVEGEPTSEETATPIVKLGCWVTLADATQGTEFRYRVVGPAEADPEESYISLASPVGKALMGQELGAMIQVQTPRGPRQFRIARIE